MNHKPPSTLTKIVPDTSVLIRGALSRDIESGKLKHARIIIPKAVVDELQSQASRHRGIGVAGLEEIKKIRALGVEHDISVEFVGVRPTLEEIQLAKKGRIDAIIRDVAAKENATLVTADYIQALVAQAEGVAVDHIPQIIPEKIKLEDFFTKDTQSVHLKVGVPPMAKRGKPGAVELVQLSKTPMEEGNLKAIINEIGAKARADDDSFIEMERGGAMVIQLGDFRVVVTRQPLSEALELTVVRPIAKPSLADYHLTPELRKRIGDVAQGTLIAGSPGAGKSSFATAVAEELASHGKIVKTFEHPRDLQVGKDITQYGPLEGNWEKTADILLLVRPDYTIFDEIRRTHDFRVFADLRLAGVGMIGVIHATDPVSAVQRFIGRIELGIIPHVIDTIIYIDGGKVTKVYILNFLVKVPSGMTEADLARPVVEVRDMESNTLEYEIYTFGEENVMVPVGKEKKKSGVQALAAERIAEELEQYDRNAEVEVLDDHNAIVRVANDRIGRVVGTKGSTIQALEKRLGIHISVEPKNPTLKAPIEFEVRESGAYISILVDNEYSGRMIDVYHKDDYIFSPLVGGDGQIAIRKKSETGKRVLRALASKKLRVLA
ncbi:MAG: PINc/VapC family ATPase [Nanoarchaeota archaeon]|nr:PINc/VapC family ATPase [Nanoarchaeota archaeon]